MSFSKKERDTETQAQRGPTRGEVEAETERCIYRPRSQEGGGLPQGLRRNHPCSHRGFGLMASGNCQRIDTCLLL